MELKVKELLKEHKEVVDILFPVIEKGNFYLADGTALYYYLKHRYSIDLDFFTQEKIDLRDFIQYFSPEAIKTISKDTIHAKIKEVNVYFIMKKLKIKSDEAIKLFVKKFGKYEENYNKKALAYFEDAEYEPEIPLLKKLSERQ